MVLTESKIKKIIEEAVRQLLNELSVGEVGRSGPLTEANMFDPSDKFAPEHKLSTEIYQKHKENPRYRVNLDKVFGNTEAYKVYKNYESAMMSKEGKRAVGFMNWIHFVCDGKKGQKIMGFESDGNYLFGYWIQGYFLCAYFAPAGKFGMFKVIKDIAQYNNIIFAVTQDLSPMLERLGIPKAEKTHDAPWQDKVVTKDVFGTSQEAIEKGFEILDQSLEMKDAKNNLSKELTKDEIDLINRFAAGYKTMSPEQKKLLKSKLISLLQKEDPELLEKLRNNGFRG